jgi:hypothetical protein
VVVLHLLTHENSDASRLVESCDQIAGLVQRAMPIQVTGGPGEQQRMRLLRVNLMVPESDLVQQSLGIIEPGWEVNAIVSPEDRPDLDRVSVFVRKSSNLHGHGLAAVVSVGGVWSGADVGAFDHYQSDSTGGGREVAVIRCQTKVVVGDDRTPEVAAKVIETVQGSDSGAVHLVTWGVPADNATAVVESSINKLFEGPEWAPTRRTKTPLEKVQVSLGTLLRNWALFQLQLPVTAIKFLFGLGRNAAEQAVTAVTVGRGAGEVGRVRPLTPEQVMQIAQYRVDQLSEELKPERLRDEASAWGQRTPTAWRELRELAIGLVDGSRMPDRFSRTHRGGQDEVVTPGYVVPSPEDELRLLNSQSIGSLDVQGLSELRQQLAVEADPTNADSSAKTRPDVAVLDEGPSDADRLQQWVERREDSLMWRLAVKVYELRRQQQVQAQAAHDALTNTKIPDTKRLKPAKTLVLISWIVTLVGLIYLALVVYAGMRDDPVAFLKALPQLNWENVAKTLLIIVLVLLAAGTFYFQTLRAYEWQVMQRLRMIREASDDYVAARQQERRWALMYEGVQDWGAVFAELLHRPWRESPRDGEDQEGTYDGLPAAVAVARATGAKAAPDQRVVTRSVEAICQRGWIAAEFQRIVEQSPINDPGAQPHAGGLPADLDLGLRSNGPRAELVLAAQKLETKAKATAHLLEEVTDVLNDGEVKMPPQIVVRLGQYSAGDSVVDREYFGASTKLATPLAPELFDPEALVERLNFPERVVFCLPTGLSTPSLPNAEVHYCGTSVATRVDISQQLRASAIKLFARARLEQGPGDLRFQDFN